jgi:hypothetical protein
MTLSLPGDTSPPRIACGKWTPSDDWGTGSFQKSWGNGWIPSNEQALSPENKVNLDIKRDVDGFPVSSAWTEFPLHQCRNGVFIESQTQPAKNFEDFNSSITSYDCREENGPLVMGFSRLF